MYQRVVKIAEQIKQKLFSSEGSQLPLIGVVLGSGLGGFADKIDNPKVVHYSELEGFVVSTVEGHSGCFVSGEVSGVRVIAMQGRVHYYEGYSMEDVVLGVRVMALLGVKVMVVTNAAGGVNPDYEVGDIMLIRDQINMLPNPLIGRNIEELGVRFVDMTQPFSMKLRDIVKSNASELGIELREGVYLGSSGPTYESKAEYKFFNTIGADACGMSTTGEVIAARHAGVDVLGFSVITNIGFGDKANEVNLHSDVVEASNMAAGRLEKLLEVSLSEIVSLYGE